MACIITYKNNKYSQQEFEKYFKNNFNEFVNEFLSQDIESFKEFVNQNATNNLQSDISNLNLTEEVLNYFYENSSKSKDFTNFVVDLKRYVNLLQNVKTNEEIVELIKCL